MMNANEMKLRTEEAIKAEPARLAALAEEKARMERELANARWESAVKFCEEYIVPMLEEAGCNNSLTLPELFGYDTRIIDHFGYGHLITPKGYKSSYVFYCKEDVGNRFTHYDKETLTKYLESLGYKVEFDCVHKRVYDRSKSGMHTYYDEERDFYTLTIRW